MENSRLAYILKEMGEEHLLISNTYLHLDKWRAGLGYADWYLNKPAYRDNNLVYK
ncbi:MAG TPA: hypothetical protein VGB63_06930 [Pedobacter sp.]